MIAIILFILDVTTGDNVEILAVDGGRENTLSLRLSIALQIWEQFVDGWWHIKGHGD